MSSPLQLKLYRGDEIRRLSLHRQSLTFAELEAAVRRTMGLQQQQQQQQQKLRLRWEDADGDRVTIDSDEELQEAAKQTPSDGTLKIFVDVVAGDGESPVRHPGVVCDGCSSDLLGLRYKCLLCPDFDLCSSCLAADLHTEHPMLLIRRPGDAGCGLPPGGWGWRGGWRMGGGWRRFCGGAGQAAGGHGCRRRFAEKMHQQYQHFQQQCHNFQQQFQQQQQQQQQQPEDQQKQQEQEQQQQLHHMLEQATNAINVFMHPFGIDASFEVKEQQEQQQQQEEQQEQQQQEEEEQQQQQQQQPDSRRQQEQQNVDAAIKASLLTEAANIDAKCQEAQQPQQQQQQQQDFEMVDPDLDSSQHEQQQQQQQQPQDPRVARALEHMQAMGFSDDGGWLTRLLEAKDGDICAVLDAIRPTK